MTNLQLGARRGNPAELRNTMGEAAWHRALRTCEEAMAAFPDSLYAGMDLLIAPGWQRNAVAEVNAFGDFLPGEMHGDRDTYSWELEALENSPPLGQGRGNGSETLS